MNKTAIKNFAIWARNKIIADIIYKAGLLGITEKEIKNPLPQSSQTVQFFDVGTKEPYTITGVEIEQRKKLAEEIQRKAKQSDYKASYKSVIEEVAYTWFNRLIAIRFMEVNDYLPTRIRVLSSESSNKIEPDLVTRPMDADLDYTPYERDRIIQLKNENKLDELFRMLFIKQCNALNDILPELFEKTNDYSEILLNVSFTDQDGVVYHLVHDIENEDFKEAVEIIGWMYQYYNEERKNEVINIYKGTIKKEDIPAATQLFTTDWVVRYMVDNSLGRYWIERNPQSKLQAKLEYFITPKNGQIQYVNEKVTPEELTFFDPCMGSGHILVYAFDILMEIYRESGYGDKDAAQSIVKNNLFGLDIDNRAYQLAYFAIMMKARSYDRRFLTREIEPNVSAIVETNSISKFTCDGVTNDKEQNQIGEYLISAYKHAKEFGSLISVKKHNYKAFKEYLNNCSLSGQLTMDSDYWVREIMPTMKKIAKQALLMSNKYAVVCTNPPYLNKLEGQLKKFVVEEYKPYSGDLFSVFMYRNFGFCVPGGYSAFMTPFVWMFIKTYENLREYIIKNKSITTLVQMEYSAFEEATVPICSLVLKNGKEKQGGLYIKLSEFKGGMEVQKQKVLEALIDKQCGYFYETNEESFSKIPGYPIAYWLSSVVFSSFENPKISIYIKPRIGLVTGDTDRFLRLWFEPSYNNLHFNCESNNEAVNSKQKWFPYQKGGAYRKWYGNNEYVINWQNDGWEIKNDNFSGSRVKSHNYNGEYAFREAITWTKISSSKFACRFVSKGYMFDDAGPICTVSSKNAPFMLALLNSKVGEFYLSVLSPTMNILPGHINSLPVLYEPIVGNKRILSFTQQIISISKLDWDSYETSWDFRKHPLLNGINIKSAFENWENECDDRFNQLKAKEEELNRIFIDIYGLQEEMTSKIEDKDLTIRKADLERDIRSFVSYAVGCMFGRYSLDMDGLAYAGGIWEDGKYSTFIPDKDNILPITDEEYFEDDIVGLFCAFIKKTFGEETLEENLDFIANALGNKGNSSREIVRNYFLKDFFKDHCKIYQKRPIYWVFDSGKADGFKALVYLHRYNVDTIGNLRIDYLHRIQRVYESEIGRMQETIDNSTNSREVNVATKRKEKLVKQLKETKEYDEKIAHLALARIRIDLDDGIKINYDKVQTDTDGKKLNVLTKIN